MSDVAVALKKVKNDYIKSMPATRPEAAQWSALSAYLCSVLSFLH
jgi:hypothetical protein